MKWIETVPNFSEGRRKEVVDAIIAQAKPYDRVWILDHSMDYDHNRSVVTLVGEPESILKALFDMTKKASELIDLRVHRGEHPRMGAADVIPLIPLRNVTTEECVEHAAALGKRIAEELKIPVYLYEKSATREERKDLSNIRQGQFEGFAVKIQKPEWAPDFGERQIHPSAGVSALGVREFLIAFNVNLKTQNLDIANKIAKAIRNISGGFHFVKALGMELKEKQMVQVSINMTNYKKSTLFRVFETVKLEAERYGVAIDSSEIVGLTPLQALIDVASFYLRLDGLTPENVLEMKMLEIMMKTGNGQKTE
ncbi:MAG: glutamate formimidoyltransferase [Thermotogota bacterium]|nr:glutamate formimidoyltransferase [Thermotogota bacterium]HPM20761.1 glutamate formimidoyltransferase [Thermotogota bacterium]